MTEYAKLVVAVDSTQAKQTIDVLIRLDDAGRKVDDTNRKMERSSRSLTSTLTRLAAPLAAFLSVRAVIRASDEYGQMASRIRNATGSAEEYVMVQDRLLETANGTYRALSEAQEVYLATADTLRDLGYATSEVLDITDSFSYALVRDAARADQATSAMDAYSKALMKGKIDADAWATIMAATPSLVEGISDATGVATDQIRKLGATGKLSVEALNEGLRRSRDENKRLADAMETSVEDALINLQTQFGVFVGKVNESSEASGVLVQSLEEMAAILADPKTIEAAQQLAGGVVSAFNSIATVVRETVGVVRWGAESLAAALHGPAADDIVRLQDQLETYQEMLANPLKRVRIGGDGQAVKLFSEEEVRANITVVQSQIDAFWENASKMPPLITPAVVEETERQAQRLVSAVASGGTEVDNLAKRISTSYSSTLASLQRQVALYGEVSEVAKLRYEIENGNLQGLASKQIQYLEGLATELDAKRDLTEQEQRRIEILRESGQLRAANDAQFELEYAAKIAEYERQGNQEALQRLETLRRIREVQLAADQAPGTVEGVSQAPRSQGIDAMFGGAAGELLKLQEQAAELEAWRQTELEKQQGFLEAKAINEEVYAERVRNIHEQNQAQLANLEQARTQLALASTEQLFGSLTSMASTFAGEQSGIYRAMFAVQKAAAIAQSIIAIQQGIAMAAANPWPANLGAMASVAAATAGIVSNIASVQSFDGGGYTGNGPRSGGLDGKGGFMAMVHPQETIIDHAKRKPGRAGGPPEVNFTAQVVIEAQAGMSPEETRAQGEMAAGAMRATFMSMIEKESRPGGLLWSLYGGGR